MEIPKVSLLFLCLALIIVLSPVFGSNPVSHPMDNLFGSNVYKAILHVNAADKGEISQYYHRYVAGYEENGFDAVFVTMDDDLMNITGEQPYSGGFESVSSWDILTSDSSVPGDYLVEQSPAKYLGGNHSLHLISRVPGNDFGYAGLSQNTTWQVSQIAANLNLKFSVYPIALENKTSSADSFLTVELGFNYYDSKDHVPKMFLVIQDNLGESLSNELPFNNGTDVEYYVLNDNTPLKFESWNNFNVNITDLAIGKYGIDKAFNLKINSIQIGAYSRNDANAELYVDSMRLNSNNSVDETYSILSQSIKSYDSSNFRMVPGERINARNVLLYFNLDNYFPKSSDGTRKTINNVHSNGDYIFVSKPGVDSESRDNMLENLWPVDGMAVYFSRNMEPNGFATDIWDYYLSRGIFAQAIAEAHPMYVNDPDYSIKWAPVQYIYADSNSPDTLVEAMAQGRSFIESSYIKPTMLVLFSAENQQIPMGKFPIYVDSGRDNAILNVNLQNIPSTAKTLRLVMNGTVIDSVPLSGSSYNNVFTPHLPDKSEYFRLEILNHNGTIIALSNPIVYSKKDFNSNDIWLALSPSLQYGSAKSSIDLISYSNDDILSFDVHSLDSVEVTTKIFSARSPSSISGVESWNYDSASNVLSVNTAGNTHVSVSLSGEAMTNIAINSPSNSIFDHADILLDVDASANSKWIKYSIDGSSNVTGCESCSSLSEPLDFSEGQHSIKVYASSYQDTISVASVSFVVDTMPPSISTHADEVAEATSSLGAVVNYIKPNATDAIGIIYDVSCLPNSGSRFPIGITTVECQSADEIGNTALLKFNVTVADTTPPTITVPPDIIKEATGEFTEVALGTANVADAVDTSFDVINNASGLFGLGTTIVDWTVTDSSGNLAIGKQNVTITDTTPPIISLSGPDHSVVNFGSDYVDFGSNATDLVDGNLTANITVDNPVNTSIVGTYKIIYRLIDSHGNNAANVFRTVEINPNVEVTRNKTEIILHANNTFPINITVPSSVGNANLHIDDLNSTNSTLNSSVNITASTSIGKILVFIPSKIKISVDSGWNGKIILPHLKSRDSAHPVPSNGKIISSVDAVVEIGYDNDMTFDKAVKIVIPGMAGKLAGYSRNGNFASMTNTCSANTQEAGDSLPIGGECRIDVDSDMVVWTKHFTEFIAYTETTPSPSPAPANDNIQTQSAGSGGVGVIKQESRIGVDVVSPINFVTQPAGSIASHLINVKNTGIRDGKFSLSISGIPSTWYSITEEKQIAYGSTGTLSYILILPRNVTDTTFTITVTGSTSSGITASKGYPVTLTVTHAANDTNVTNAETVIEKPVPQVTGYAVSLSSPQTIQLFAFSMLGTAAIIVVAKFASYRKKMRSFANNANENNPNSDVDSENSSYDPDKEDEPRAN